MTPFLLVLLAYYVNGAAFLAFSSIAERRGVGIADGRSLSFIGGLAEGTETVFVHPCGASSLDTQLDRMSSRASATCHRSGSGP